MPERISVDMPERISGYIWHIYFHMVWVRIVCQGGDHSKNSFFSMHGLPLQCGALYSCSKFAHYQKVKL
jgi:hypothetical protein